MFLLYSIIVNYAVYWPVHAVLEMTVLSPATVAVEIVATYQALGTAAVNLVQHPSPQPQWTVQQDPLQRLLLFELPVAAHVECHHRWWTVETACSLLASSSSQSVGLRPTCAYMAGNASASRCTGMSAQYLTCSPRNVGFSWSAHCTRCWSWWLCATGWCHPHSEDIGAGSDPQTVMDDCGETLAHQRCTHEQLTDTWHFPPHTYNSMHTYTSAWTVCNCTGHMTGR